MYLITASKFLKQKLKELRREMDLFTLNSKKFSTPFSIIDRASRKKISSVYRWLEHYQTTYPN